MSQDTINAVLIALDEDSLLLPNLAVAEVLSKDLLQKNGEGTSALAGHVLWNGKKIPVVNFEVLNGAEPQPEIPRRGRVTLLHSIGTHSFGTIGVMTQGYPHLVTLNRDAMQPGVLRESDRRNLVMARVNISNQEVLVPDFDAIEYEIMRLQGPETLAH